MTESLHEKINCTPHLSDFGVCLDKDGQDNTVAVLKATYLFDEKGNVTEAEEDQRLPVFKIGWFIFIPFTRETGLGKGRKAGFLRSV